MPRRGPSFEKAKDFKGSIRRVFHYMSNYKLSLIFVFLFSILSAVFAIIGPKILGQATTEIFNGLVGKVMGTSAGIDFSKIAGILLTLLGLYLLSMLFSYIQGFLMVGVSQKLTFKLRCQISDKFHRLPLRYYETKTTGEILSRVTNDVDVMSQTLDQTISQLLTQLTTMIGVFVMMLSINVFMTIAVLVIIPISLFLISFIVSKSQRYFADQQKYLGKINGQIEENYAGAEIVKIFNQKDTVIEEFNKTNQKLYQSAWKSQFLSGLMHPMMMFVGNIGYVLVSILGGYMVIQEKIAVGDILSFTQYVRNFTNPIAQIAQSMNMIQQLAAASERVFQFLDAKEEVKDTKNPKNVDSIEGNISFDHVQFGYQSNKTVIHDFSANIKKGQKIAIVGPTGAGKTTMVKLLMRFYDVDRGSIRIDNIDIKDFKRDDLRNLFGMVLQDTWLYSDTIRENIRYGNLNATNEQVEDVAIMAKIDHFIRTLPQGYDMVVNEASDNISEGQKQLLTIARVILKDPKILILDEATSSVDTRMEILIQKAMDKLMEGRTSFIIAHRLSTIRNADLILVMKDGDIVEQGNHEQLLSKNGFYATLYNSQFEEVES